MIKVVHISTFQVAGGAAIAASRLNKAVNTSGGKSTLLVAKGGAPASNVLALDGQRSGKLLFWSHFVMERTFFLLYEKNTSVRYAFSPAISGMNLSNHPVVKEADIIHLHWVNFGLLSINGIQQLFELGKPVVWTLHDMWAFTGGCHNSGDCRQFEQACGNCSFLRNPREKDLSYRTLAKKKEIWKPKSDFVTVTCSKWLGQEARKSALFSSFELTNIPNPIDTSVFKPQSKSLARTALGLPADKKYLLFAAAKVTSEGKGFSYLIDALKRLLEEQPIVAEQLELLVIGSGDESGLTDVPLKAHFLGYVSGDDNLLQVYNAASVYITPSLQDNLPNTVMEALACGTPVVGFRTGGIPEMIDHLQNGFVADYKSSESLAEGIRWVLDQLANDELSEAARQKALSRYDERVVGRQYLTLYSDLLKRGPNLPEKK